MDNQLSVLSKLILIFFTEILTFCPGWNSCADYPPKFIIVLYLRSKIKDRLFYLVVCLVKAMLPL